MRMSGVMERLDDVVFDTVEISALVERGRKLLFVGPVDPDRNNYQTVGQFPYDQTFKIQAIGLGLDCGTGPEAEATLRMLLGGLTVVSVIGDKNCGLPLHSMLFYPGGEALLAEDALTPELLVRLEKRPTWALGGFCGFLAYERAWVIPPRQHYHVEVNLSQAACEALRGAGGLVRVFLAGSRTRDVQ